MPLVNQEPHVERALCDRELEAVVAGKAQAPPVVVKQKPAAAPVPKAAKGTCANGQCGT